MVLNSTSQLLLRSEESVWSTCSVLLNFFFFFFFFFSVIEAVGSPQEANGEVAGRFSLFTEAVVGVVFPVAVVVVVAVVAVVVADEDAVLGIAL